MPVNDPAHAPHRTACQENPLMKPLAIVLALFVIGFGMKSARAIDVGDKAPSFDGTDDQGNPWKSADHVGKGVLVVYFYPADLTGGCTKQACGFRDDMKELAAKGVEVVGVSGDSVANHQLFKKAKNLNFTLLADEKGEIAKAFGVPTRAGGVAKVKTPDGKTHSLTRGITAARWTFVIDKEGKIALRTKVSDPSGDAKAVAAAVDAIKK
jgi:peroxiredoxin Q/BCP